MRLPAETLTHGSQSHGAGGRKHGGQAALHTCDGRMLHDRHGRGRSGLSLAGIDELAHKAHPIGDLGGVDSTRMLAEFNGAVALVGLQVDLVVAASL